MPQLHITAIVEQGSPTVTLPQAEDISIGDYFKRTGLPGTYEVGSVAGATVTLTAPYLGEPGEYECLFHRDFTEMMGYPLIYAGDVDVPDILRRWALKADREVGDVQDAAAATAADRIQTGLDRQQTGLDAQTATDQAGIATAAAQSSAEDALATAADRVQTGLDRQQTGQDAQAATDQAGIATAKAADASDSALRAEQEADRAEQEAGNAAAVVATHEAKPDPHPQYTTVSEAAAAAPVQSVVGTAGDVTAQQIADAVDALLPLAQLNVGKSTTTPATPASGSLLSGAMLAAGAMVEWGENANGQYWRWESGLQVCTQGKVMQNFVVTPMGHVYMVPSEVWTFPAAFTSLLFLDAAEVSGVGYSWGALGQDSANNTSMSYTLMRASPAEYAPKVALFALGRWK